MSISLNDHETRIKSLESQTNSVGKLEHLYSFTSFSDPINKTFTFSKSWSEYDWILFYCGRYVSSSVVDNNEFMLWPTSLITTTDNTSVNSNQEYCLNLINAYAMFVFRTDKKSITFNETSYGRIRSVYGLKLYYNFSYNICSLISHFWNNFITKEVQEVEMSISLKSLYDQVQSISLSGVKNIHKATNGYVEFYNGLTINWGISGPGLPPGSGSQWKSYSWVKPFTNACVAVTTGDISGNYSGSNNPINLRSVSKTGVQILQFDNFKCYWIAIGYLISDRILKYIIYAVDFLALLINWRCKISMAISLKALYDQVQAIKTSQSTWTTGSGTNGRWWKESSTGLIIQAGEHYHPENPIYSMLTFPISFSTDKSYGINTTSMDSYATWTTTPTTSSVQVDTDGKRNSYVRWVAIGY